MLLRKTIVMLFSILCIRLMSSKVYAQKQHLELKNIRTNKVRKVKENEQITVHTTYFKIKGLLKIIDKKL